MNVFNTQIDTTIYLLENVNLLENVDLLGISIDFKIQL